MVEERDDEEMTAVKVILFQMLELAEKCKDLEEFKASLRKIIAEAE